MLYPRPMPTLSRRLWREPPIAFQILVLLLGGLVVAQFVTLLLTIVLPPAPPMQHSLDDIVAALGGQERGRLVRAEQPGPPAIGGPGWFTSEKSSAELAQRIGAAPRDVRLAFYAPLPFAGTTQPPVDDSAGMHPIAWSTAQAPLVPLRAGLIRAALLLDDQPSGGSFPGGGGFPNGGGGFPGAGGFPGGMGARMPGGEQRDGMGRREGGFGRQGAREGWIGGGRDLLRQDRQSLGRLPTPGDLARQPVAPGFDRDAIDRAPIVMAPPPAAAVPVIAPPAPSPADLDRQPVAPDPQPAPRAEPRRGAPEPAPAAAPAPTQPRAEAAPVPAPAPVVARRAPATTTVEADPVPIAPQGRALFGLAPAPFVEGDFIAAVRRPGGGWTVVQPAAEAFPNAWQRRVILWFAIAFAIVAPIGWLYARHIVRPLARFTDAAEKLGRDPSAALVALEGPAEIGRAAHAFNVMQSRLRSFVDDRTAMVGAISHDLRTPLTRLRFRIEEVEDEGVREGMNQEVAEMEAMISSVLAFIRDASTPNVRETLDLGLLVEDVAQDATLVGGDVTVEVVTPAPVEVDVLGMRRLLANLVENAVKYGDRARIRLGIEEDAAVAEIADDGPGIPEDELERAFEPFYRASNAQSSGKDGTGLGLAVCRSIARAHGGDVRLVRRPDGFAAQLRLPLAYAAAKRLAA